ncbi:MAG: hypothetical protein ACI9KE_003868 [Polyangiales bacterium]|jgi:hypothetical protein
MSWGAPFIMSALTSLLVRDQKVPVRKIEEAIQRQVIAGGGFDTILLEAKLLPENEIASYCAAVHGLSPATRAECMDVPRDVVRTVPNEVAERHRLVPLDFDGQRLVVAVDQPLPFEVDQQLGFLLGVTVEQRIAPEMRIAAALQQHFGIEMVPRMRRLVEKQSSISAGSAVFIEPLVAPVETKWPSDQESNVPTKQFGSVVESSRAPVGDLPGQPVVTTTRTVSLGEYASPSNISSAPEPPSTVSLEEPLQTESATSSPPEVAERLRRLSAPPQPSRISVPQSQSLLKHRGPLTARRAVELLKGAEGRDEILEISFAFFRQFFDVSALFVIQAGEAEGLEITGPGADLSRFERLGVPLDEPSAFQLVTEGGVPIVDGLERTELDRKVRSDMARVDLTPVLLLPIKIRNRVVLVFYGDRSGEAFTLADIPEPLAFAPRVTEALQQLILRRKFQTARPAPTQETSPSVEAPILHRGVNDTLEPAAPAYLLDLEVPAPESLPPDPQPPKSQPPKSLPPKSLPPKSLTRKSLTLESPTPEYSTPAGEVPPVVAEDESHVRWSEPPPPPPSRKPRGRVRSPSFDVLGVPRSAPPPPMPGEQPQVTAPSGPPLVAETDEDFPELSLDEEPLPQRRVGSYVMKGGTTEVVRTSKYTPATENESKRLVSDWPDSLDLPTPVAFASPDPEVVHDEADPELSEREKRTSASPIPLTSTLRRPSKPSASDLGEEIIITEGGLEHASSEDATSDSVSLSKASARKHRQTGPDTPSVIIEMGDSIEAVVEDLRFSGPDEPEAAVRAVVQQGEAALPVLVREFPGPLFFDRSQPHRRLPRGRDISAVGRAIAAFGDLAVPYVISLFDRDDADDRFYAVLLSSEFSHARLVQPLGDRIFDDDRGVGTLALDVLRTLLPFERELAALTERLRAEARIPSASLETRVMALRALGELRDRAGLDMLALFVEKEREELAEAAHRSLVQITRQDFGDAVPRWLLWIDNNYERHRVEWLIDSLSHVDEAMRRDAADELKALTHEYYGYHPSLSKKEREIAQKKYRRWWEAEGHLRFTR